MFVVLFLQNQNPNLKVTLHLLCVYVCLGIKNHFFFFFSSGVALNLHEEWGREDTFPPCYSFLTGFRNTSGVGAEENSFLKIIQSWTLLI